ncbi:MAG: RDD family protein [Halococcoides sp.]
MVLEWAWNGQTVGKKLVGIRVRDRFSAGPAGPGQVFVRNLPAVLVFSWLSIVVGLAAIAISNQNQRLFDQAASTIVTRA